MIIALYLVFVTGLLYCNEEIVSLTILIYEDGNVLCEKFEPELGAEGMKFAVFYEVTENVVRRYYTHENGIQITDYSVLSREKDRDKERICAENTYRGKITIIFFPNNHATIIYYNKKMLSIEEAVFRRMAVQD
jgi:hypothetical protein